MLMFEPPPRIIIAARIIAALLAHALRAFFCVLRVFGRGVRAALKNDGAIAIDATSSDAVMGTPAGR